MTRGKVWLFTAGTLVAFALAGLLSGSLLGLAAGDAWVLGGGILFLGLLAALLVYLYLSAKVRPEPVQEPVTGEPDDELEGVLAAAHKRLAAAGLAGSARLARLPVILVLGPGGSAKTTTVVHSGLEPELLAGEAHRGDAVVPTGAANVWFAQGTVLLEAGGKLAADASRWSRLVGHIQPSRWAAVLSRGRQAPRVAVVCFGCDELLKPGAASAVPAAAKRLRARLLEVSGRLGIRLPVYVVFTKTDRLPYFGDYVRSLTRDEAREVLGATLPAAPPAHAGVYAEQESGRLRAAFHGILRAVALKRPELLAREVQEELRAGAYEYPRELGKVADLVVQFLLDLCRPGQLGVSPFLRGFYFTGVRPVVVHDAATDAAGPAHPAHPGAALDATAVFNPGSLRAPAPPRAAAAGPRRVPEWVFLDRLFREVVLRDRAAMDATAGGTRVNLWRRLLLGSAAAVFAILSIGMTASYFNNRTLQRDALAAARAAETMDVTGAGVPPLEDLQRLDGLRQTAAGLRGFERDGHPLRLRWGLYTGAATLSELRRLYFDRFEPLLWQRTRSALRSALDSLPATPEEATTYTATYDALKAHLVTTSHPRESTPEFLTPVLLKYWAGTREPEPERVALVRRQFDFFGGELEAGNPYDDRPDAEAVERARIHLQRFANVEPFYQAMVSMASDANEAIRFSRRFPGSESVLRNDLAVPGAFTRDGWTAVQADLAQVDRLFAREDWVVGERAVPPEDRARLAHDIRVRYVADYIRHWREFLEAASAAGYAGAADAARKLARQSGNQSPLLQMLALVSEQTAVDSTVVGPAFAPVHAVVPPGATERYIGDANQGYMAALAALQTAMDQVAGAAGGARNDALAQAAASAEQVKLAVRQLARGFSIDGDARAIGRAVELLLLAPVTRAEALVRNLPAAELNRKGAEFCRAIRGLTGKYPFAAQASAAATMDEVAAVFQPGASALWAFYEDALRDVLVPQGTRYGPPPGAAPRPTAEFTAFFNRAAELSRALYGEDGAGPQVIFALRPQTSSEIPEVTVTIDGQSQRFTRTFAATKTFVWEASAAGAASVVAGIDGAEVTLARAEPGPWAVFRLFRQAAWERLGNGRYRVRWNVPGRSLGLSAEVSFEAGVPIFMEDYLAGFDCVPRIAR